MSEDSQLDLRRQVTEFESSGYLSQGSRALGGAHEKDDSA